MVTKSKRRVRVPKPKAGTPVTYAEIEELLGPPRKTVQYWEKKGEVQRFGRDSKTGAAQLDFLSVWERCRMWTPNEDSSARKRVRSRTIPQMLAEAQSNGHSNGHNNGVSHTAQILTSPAVLSPISPAPISGQVLIPVGESALHLPAGVKPLMPSETWLPLYYREQTRRHGVDGKLAADTEGSYDWVFDRFKRHFKYLPLDRKVILDYIHGLKNLKNGRPLSGGSKMLVHRQLCAMYNWLVREKYLKADDKPDLSNPGISDNRARALPLRIGETRLLRKALMDATEHDILTILAQTGMRAGELCTIRPETTHDHWVEVFGKVTKFADNRTGWRQVPLPDESWRRLQRAYNLFGGLVWVNRHGLPRPLAGPIQRAPGSRRAIDLTEGRDASFENPVRTYRVRPDKGSVQCLEDLLRRRLKEAGVYEHGKNAHSLRRVFQGEFLDNGGSVLAMRRIMGHFSAKNMDDLYYRRSIEELVAEMQRCAPRRFLREEATQGELQLDAVIQQLSDDDDDEE